MTYSFHTRKWKTLFSFNFLQEVIGRKAKLSYYGSVAGLFLVGNVFSRVDTYHVCNPLTRTSILLPLMSQSASIVPPLSRSARSAISMGIYHDEEDKETYKVVAIGMNVPTVEIYDSSKKCWKIAGQVPKDVLVFNMRYGVQLIFCNGFFYSIATNETMTDRSYWFILGFNMANGTSNVSPLPLGIPVLMVNRWNLPQLLKCRSRILLAAGVTDEAQHLETIII